MLLNPTDILMALLHAEDVRIECKETPKAYVFSADLPGLSRKEVKLEVVDGRILQISGERRKEEELGEEETWHCRERPSGGPFLRRLRLPEDVDADLAKARMENGVLTLTVPKAEAELKRTKGRAVEISDGEHKKSAGRRKKGMLCCGLAV